MRSRYQFCARLFQGSVSEIFLVYDHIQEQCRVLKRIIKHHNNYTDSYLFKIYKREIQMLGWLKADFIPNLIEAFEEEFNYCIVMEYIPGKPLSYYCGNKVNEECKPWYMCLAEHLRTLHRQGVVHLDIKPQNIIVWKNQLFLIDFANSCFLFEPEIMTGISAGYAPMEAGTMEADERSDIYSFGKTCYVLRHGCFPEANKNPDELDTIFLRCFRDQKQDRYANMAEVIKELELLCLG